MAARASPASVPVVANARPEERKGVYRRFLVYSILVVIAGPLLAWLVFILPGWM